MSLTSASKLGAYSVGTGYKVAILLNDVTITDDEVLKSIISDLNNNLMPELGFQGKFRRADDLAERIVFRNCSLVGEIDLMGLAKGFVWDLNLTANILTDEQINQFKTHG